jgi:hypothetical protein
VADSDRAERLITGAERIAQMINDEGSKATASASPVIRFYAHANVHARG